MPKLCQDMQQKSCPMHVVLCLYVLSSDDGLRKLRYDRVRYSDVRERPRKWQPLSCCWHRMRRRL